MSKTKTKLLILGLDGATFNLIRPWAEQGHLPNLAKLMQTGSQRDLRSTLPPVTSPAWPSFMTGCNPGKHGVFDFIAPAGNSYTLVNATRLKQPTLWQILSKMGYTVGVMNVPVTYPPQPVNGFTISGILTPNGVDFSYPADLIGKYESELGPYRISPDVQYRRGNEETYIPDMYDLIRSHGEWALHMMKHETADVHMVHFIAMDLMCHALWWAMDESHPKHEPNNPYKHAIRDGYKLVDEYAGKMIELLPEDAHVLVMSDHGFGPLNQIVNLNNLLMKHGKIKLRRHPWTRLKAFAFKYGLTPSGVYKILERLGIQNIATKVSKNTRNKMLGKFLSFEDIDWKRTTAYSMGHVGQIYLNMRGREPHGIVTEYDYEEKRQEIVDVLHQLKDKNGRKLVTQIILREDTYSGEFTEDGPDIHVVIDDYNMIAFPLFATDGKIVTDQIRGDTGCHRSEGIFIAHGPKVTTGDVRPEANILDISPTVFALLNEPVPQHMDGQVLKDIFNHEPDISYKSLDDLDLADDHHLSEDDEKEVEERLRSLGYL
ncbi:MAG: alkaline phosphatase family protein [Chloroflexota bacterium]